MINNTLMKKYSLTKNTKRWMGKTLYQIKAEVSFGIVPKGTLGGYIEKEENLSQEGRAWVFDNVWVFGDAQIFGNARVSGDAQIFGNAQVSGDVWVFGDAQIFGNAQVSGDAQIFGNARVSGDAQIFGNARVSGDAQIFGNAQVSGDVRVYGNARVSAKASFTKGSFIGGDDTEKITNIIKETGSNYWKAQYVLGDYEITPIKDFENEGPKDDIIELDGKKYKRID